jgi:hypothetical protein
MVWLEMRGQIRIAMGLDVDQLQPIWIGHGVALGNGVFARTGRIAYPSHQSHRA